MPGALLPETEMLHLEQMHSLPQCTCKKLLREKETRKIRGEKSSEKRGELYFLKAGQYESIERSTLSV